MVLNDSIERFAPMLEKHSNPNPSLILHPMNDFRDDFVGCKAVIEGTIDEVVTIVKIDGRVVYFKDVFGIVSSVSWVKVKGILPNDDVVINA